MVDPFIVYENLGNVISARDGMREGVPLIEAELRKTLSEIGYVVVKGTRKGHTYRPDSRMVFILFSSSTIRISQNSKFIETWKKVNPADDDNVVIVTHSGITHHIANTLAGFRRDHPKMYIEVHYAYKFAFNFLNSSIYCKHEIVDPEELKKVCDQQRCDPIFKKIQTNDTGAIWIGARSGDIVKITSPSHTAGYTIDYRNCIDAPA
jgi:DNA-directed RNA polymerase subunit H (RpoH/RPB5)